MRNKRVAALMMSVMMAVGSAATVPANDAFLDIDQEDGAGGIGGQEAGAVGGTADGEEVEGSLIEDEGEDVFVTDGRSYDDVKREEEEQEKARKELEELLNAQPIALPRADSEQIDIYMEALLAHPNPTGSDEEMEVAQYIEEQMSLWGYTISEQAFHEGELNEDGIDVPGINIIAERGASSEDHTDDIVVVTCHYDASASGVNDKAGAAALLEAGRILSQIDTDVDLCFVFLSGEEDGWYGSKAFAESIGDEEKARIKAVISLEDIGEGTDLYLGSADGEMNQPGNYLAAAAQLRAMDEAEEETEAAAEADKDETETADISVTDAQPFWSYIARESGAAVHFAGMGMTAVSLFRENPDDSPELLDEIFIEDEMLSEVPADEEALSEAAFEEAAEEMTEAEGPTVGEKIAGVTDILTTALTAYMQPKKAEVNK